VYWEEILVFKDILWEFGTFNVQFYLGKCSDTIIQVTRIISHTVFQNVHLVAKWLGTLEKLLEKFSQGSHRDYRVFLSAKSAPTPSEHIIPQGLLENAIKITNEPPTGMLANLHAALYNFDPVRKQKQPDQ
jgi:dynein heavy chain